MAALLARAQADRELDQLLQGQMETVQTTIQEQAGQRVRGNQVQEKQLNQPQKMWSQKTHLLRRIKKKKKSKKTRLKKRVRAENSRQF
jgi:hypothetical protein